MSSKPRKTRDIKAARRKNDENKFQKPELLTLQDMQCTVCMGIFVEPVTLPCYHTTCKVCFERTIDNNTLACPLCRKYVGGWVRQRQKNGLMVNETLWSYIRQNFDSHVQKKINGEEDEEIDGLSELNIRVPKICEPGLIRLEYEAEQRRLQEEAQRLQEQEAQASEKLIRELQEKEAEERRQLEEARRKAEEEDAIVAQRIAAELAEEDARRQAEEEEKLRSLLEEEEASSAFVRMPPHSTTLTPPSQPQKKGPMDLFLNQNGLGKQSRTGSSSSTDSLHTEMHHFRPVHYVPTTPPKLSPDGTKNDANQVCKPVPVLRSFDDSPTTPIAGPSSSTLRPWLIADALQSSKICSETPCGTNSVSGGKRDRSPTNDKVKSPKKARRESPRKNPKLNSVQDKSGLEKLKSKRASSDAENDCKGRGLGCTSSLLSSYLKTATKNSFLPKSTNGLIDKSSALMPLSIQDFSETTEIEHRYRQEKEDYELALKLQEELNSHENQRRSYELRSISSPKKSQPKILTPRSKAKPKPPKSSGKKEKRRQCTLEESMSFSVKMEL